MSLSNRRRFSSFLSAHSEEKWIVLLPCGSPTDGIPYPGSLIPGVRLWRGPSLNCYITPQVWGKIKPTPSTLSSMSPQAQPAVVRSLPSLECLAPEILEHIAFFAVEDRLLGPPSDLFALLKTSKTINWALSPENNNSLYNRVFALKFDTAAASRRLGPRWLTSKSTASELRLRFKALHRIRSGVIDGPMLQRDLWTVFFILLEHDHKNALQLTEWAKTNEFVNLVVERWLTDGYGPEFGEDAGGIVCTIIWELVREGQSCKIWTALDDC